MIGHDARPSLWIPAPLLRGCIDVPDIRNEAAEPTQLVAARFDEGKCIADKGCTVCVDVCPLDVLRISDLTGKAYMKYDECWYCMLCETDCPTGAVSVAIPYLLR